MVTSWVTLKDAHVLLDQWLIGGTLTVTAITTTGSALGQMVKDREGSRLSDLILTDLSYNKIHLSYLFSAWIIGMLMQIAMFIVMQLYFQTQDSLPFDTNIILPVLGIMALSSLVWSAFNMVLFTLVKSVDTVGHINSIISAASGFFAGVYMPLGVLPTFAQNLMKLTPAPYNAALFRQILMKKQINSDFHNLPNYSLLKFKQNLGIVVETNFSNDLKILLWSFLILLVLILVLYRYNRKIVINKI
jgi:multidrug/hemolysin transport system permease protein